MSLYDAVRDLPLLVDGYALEGLEQQVSSGFLRKSTVIRLAGAGEEGLGEDVTYEAAEHDLVQAQGPDPSARRRVDARDVLRPPRDARALRSRARPARLPRLPPLGVRERRARPRAAPGGPVARRRGRQGGAAADVRRLDAARRAGDDRAPARLARALPEPAVQARRDGRLDGGADRRARGRPARSTRSTSRASTAERRSTRCPIPALYERVVDGLPDAWLEDPALTPETEAVLEPHHERVTWDAVIHSVADIEALRWPPRTVNVKPSRFGSVERLFAAYDYCAAQRDRRLRRRAVRARGRARPDPAPGGAVPSGARRTTSRRAASTSIHSRVCPSSPLAVVPRATGFATVD